MDSGVPVKIFFILTGHFLSAGTRPGRTRLFRTACQWIIILIFWCNALKPSIRSSASLFTIRFSLLTFIFSTIRFHCYQGNPRIMCIIIILIRDDMKHSVLSSRYFSSCSLFQELHHWMHNKRPSAILFSRSSNCLFRDRFSHAKILYESPRHNKALYDSFTFR